MELSAQPVSAQEPQKLNSESLVWETNLFQFNGIVKPEYEQMDSDYEKQKKEIREAREK